METDRYIPQVRTFGALGYDAERIADLLDLHGDVRTELLIRLSIPDDKLRIAYENGRAIGEYNIDVELTKKAESGDVFAIMERSNRAHTREINDMKRKLFGI